jgi:Fic family protein
MKAQIPALLPIIREVESKAVLRKAALAHMALAELKGVISSIPNEHILLETLTLREARESSAIENIISTFDEIYQSNLFSNQFASPAAKEVHQYARALIKGFQLVKETGLLTNNHMLQIQNVVEQNNAGFRKLPGTKLLNDKTGEVVYTPPQDLETIIALMQNLETFINDDSMMDADGWHHQVCAPRVLLGRGTGANLACRRDWLVLARQLLKCQYPSIFTL